MSLITCWVVPREVKFPWDLSQDGQHRLSGRWWVLLSGVEVPTLNAHMVLFRVLHPPTVLG